MSTKLIVYNDAKVFGLISVFNFLPSHPEFERDLVFVLVSAVTLALKVGP